MGGMSNLYNEIWELLSQGQTPENISRTLLVPLSLVYEALEMEEYNPHNTVNS